MKMFLPIALALALFVNAAHSEELRDGNLWLKFHRQDKLLYLSGIFDGMPLGGALASGVCGQRGEIAALMNKVMEPLQTPQIADGLDLLYRDYRNRSILVPDAVDAVIGSIRGATPAETEMLLRRLRKTSR